MWSNNLLLPAAEQWLTICAATSWVQYNGAILSLPPFAPLARTRIPSPQGLSEHGRISEPRTQVASLLLSPVDFKNETSSAFFVSEKCLSISFAPLERVTSERTRLLVCAKFVDDSPYNFAIADASSFVVYGEQYALR